MTKPFRWNLAKREQLGQLVTAEPNVPSSEFLPELRACASRIIALTSNTDLVFIGRSPENLFDYLSGVLATTSWADRCTLVNISLRVNARGSLRQSYPTALAAGHTLLTVYGLSPESILQRSRPITFVDLVASGETFSHLATMLLDWSREDQVDVNALKQKLRFLGITRRKKTSPKTWRWQQQAFWVQSFPARQMKNVSIPSWLWDYWGNEQAKVTSANPPWRWGSAMLDQPVRDSTHLEALNFALYLYTHGASVPERLAFANQLGRSPAIREPWYRSLILELR